MGFWADLPWNKEIQRLKDLYAEARRSNKALKHSNRALEADLETAKDNLRRSESSEATLRTIKIQLEDELSEKAILLAQAEEELASRAPHPGTGQEEEARIQAEVVRLLEERSRSLRRRRPSTDTLDAPPTSKRQKASPSVYEAFGSKLPWLSAGQK